METKNPYLSFLLIIVLLALLQIPTFALKKSYIVYFGGHSHGPEPSMDDMERAEDRHHEFLASFLGCKEKARDSIIYAHTKHINAFSARLEEEVAEHISKHPDVISIFEAKSSKLHTTRVWEFLGLEKNGQVVENSLWEKANLGEDIIIANIDGGVWPESKSFSDEGLDLGPIPSRWKGQCTDVDEIGVTCNKKLISMRKYYKADAEKFPNVKKNYTIRPFNGHGTHTLSIAGGAFVAGVNSFGLGNGTAKGGAPKARLAHYRVCWPDSDNLLVNCQTGDQIAAFDQAINDGVDVFSVSLGDNYVNKDLMSGGIAISALHAVKKGIVVVDSAGNVGPDEGSILNMAPWIITVGASTMDRDFPAYLQLGDKQRLKGKNGDSSVVLPENKSYPLITAMDAKADDADIDFVKMCVEMAINPDLVKGKILVCTISRTAIAETSVWLKDAGAVGLISFDDKPSGKEALGMPAVIPAVELTTSDGIALLRYMNSTKSPVAYIEPANTELNVKPAPTLALFSSRGPNSIVPEILKPDLIAPGVQVIAATSPDVSPTGLGDDRRVNFTAFYGTSMAAPVVAGVAALLKGIHRDWSPAAIKSAMMTTASITDNTNQVILDNDGTVTTPLHIGAGHINPNKATDPGLVYDLTFEDHLNFLCGMGYNSSQVSKFSGDKEHQNFQCPKSYSRLDYNYPAITIPNFVNTVTVSRTLKNVGSSGTYKVEIVEPYGFSVKVEPENLKFEKLGEEKVFKVTLQVKPSPAEGAQDNKYVFGSLTWNDGVHTVRSPISVKKDSSNINTSSLM